MAPRHCCCSIPWMANPPAWIKYLYCFDLEADHHASEITTLLSAPAGGAKLKIYPQLMKAPPRVESDEFIRFSLFKTQVSDFRRSLDIINSTYEEVRNCVKLKEIMKRILILGNMLNQRTARGAAVGFKLDSLLKLTDTPASNGKMTLMHYLCKVLTAKAPGLLDFHKDLVHLEAASKIQKKALAEEMQAITKGFEKMKQELADSSENDGRSVSFYKSLKEFVSAAQTEVSSVTNLYSVAARNADKLSLYFGEDPARCPLEKVTASLVSFVGSFKKAHEENCELAETKKEANVDSSDPISRKL